MRIQSINQSINQSTGSSGQRQRARRRECRGNTRVLLGAERFIGSWHKSEEEASKLREVNRAA